jgi:hypothetical protein
MIINSSDLLIDRPTLTVLSKEFEELVMQFQIKDYPHKIPNLFL